MAIFHSYFDITRGYGSSIFLFIANALKAIGAISPGDQLCNDFRSCLRCKVLLDLEACLGRAWLAGKWRSSGVSWGISLTHIGSMYAKYMVTWIPSIYPQC